MIRLGLATVLALALGLATGGCGRCDGILGCTGAPRLSLNGGLIVRATGAGVSGAALDFVRTGGVGLMSDSVRTVTDGEGRFQLAVDAVASGEVSGDLVVRPPSPTPAYRVRGLTFVASTVRGEGRILGNLVTIPYIEFFGQVITHPNDLPLPFAQITVTWTGGVAVESPGTFTVPADAYGNFYFKVNTAEPGQAFATLVIAADRLPQPEVFTGVGIEAKYLDVIPRVGGVFLVGPLTPSAAPSRDRRPIGAP